MAWRSFAVYLWLLTGASCTLVSDFSFHQCESTADCDVLGGALQRCENDRCVAGCEDNHHCATVDPRTPICPALGQACTRLASEEDGCFASSTYDDATMGAWRGEDMTILGAFASTLESATWLTLELAASELEAARSTGASSLPPTVVVLCHGDEAAISGSARHLVTALRVRAAIASVEDRALQTLRQHPELGSQLLLLSPNAALSAPAGDNQLLLWHLGGRYADAVDGYSRLLRQAEANVAETSGRRLRIASLIGEALEDSTLAAAVAERIDLNGRDADYLFREDRFRRFSLPDSDRAARDAVLADLASAAPDVILSFLGGEFADPPAEPRLGAIPLIESQLPDAAVWRPLYLFSPRAQADSTLQQLAATSSGFRARTLVFGVNPAPDAALAAQLAARFDAAFPEAAGHGLRALPNVYDAVYYLAYAQAIARDGFSTVGPYEVLDGLARAVDFRGEVVDVGPRAIAAAVQHITTDRLLQLRGTTGPGQFFSAHARAGQLNLFCWAPSDSAASGPLERYYDPVALTPIGAVNAACGEDFLGSGLSE